MSRHSFLLTMCALLASVAVATLPACASGGATTEKATAASEVPHSQPASPPAYPVHLALKAKRSGAGLQMSGTADVPDGALVVCEVEEKNGAWISDDLSAEVRSGQWHANLAKVPSGRLDVWAAFTTEGVKQPAAVVARYGRRGQRIANGKKQYDGSKRVEILVHVQ